MLMFYEKFEHLCNLRKVSASAVAEAIGLNRSSATDWKHGSVPKTKTIAKLCEYFAVPFDYFEDRETDGKKWGTIIFRERLSKVLLSINPETAITSGIDIERMQQIAEGIIPITFDAACNVAGTLGESLDYLSGLIDEEDSPVCGMLIQQHFTLYNQLTDEQQRLIDAQIKGILQEK